MTTFGGRQADSVAARLCFKRTLNLIDTTMRSHRRQKAGSVLVETLFAVFLTVVCALIFGVTMPTANRSRSKADLNNLALGLAQKQMEAIKGIDPSLSADALFAAGLIDSKTPVATDTYSFTSVDSGLQDSPSRVLPEGEGFVTVESIDIELRRVTVEVRWVEDERDRVLRLGTVIADLNN